MKYKAYLYHIYCKVKNRSKEKNKSYNQIKMCTCMNCDGWNGNSFCMTSLPTYKIFLKAWLFSFFFFMDLHVSIYIFSFFNTWTFMCPHFFSIAYAFSLFFVLTITRERDQHILWSFYFVEWMDGTMLTSHRSIARGMWCAHES